MNEHSHLYNLVNGAIGAVGSFLGVLSTCQEQLEFSVRITGGLIGILVGLITLYNFIRITRASHGTGFIEEQRSEIKKLSESN